MTMTSDIMLLERLARTSPIFDGAPLNSVVMATVLHSQSKFYQFDSRPFRIQVTTLGKLSPLIVRTG